MKKTLLKSLFTAILLFTSVTLFSQSAKLVPVISEDGAIIRKVSPNGKWAVGYSSSEGDLYDATLWDLTTYKAVKLIGPEEVGGAWAVTDDGRTVVGSYFRQPVYWLDGERHDLPLPVGYVIGEVQAVNGDGTIMVGRAYDQSYSVAKACVWKNGQLEYLELPALDKLDEIADYNEMVAVSTDGRTMLGCLNYAMMESRTAFVIRDGVYRMFGAEWYDPEQGGDEYNFYDVLSMSPNGKWVTGDIYYIVEPWGDEYYCPFRYNVEEDVVELFLEDSEIASFAVDDNGNLYGAAPFTYPVRSAVILEDGHWVSLDELLMEKYGIDVTEETGYEELRNVFDVSGDGNTIVGVTEFRTLSWVLKLDSETSVDGVDSNVNPMKAVVRGGHLLLGGIVDQVKVYDMNGRSVLEKSINGKAPVFNVSHLPAGVYVVSMMNADKKVVNQKVQIGH